MMNHEEALGYVERLARLQSEINRLESTLIECKACRFMKVGDCENERDRCDICKGTGWVKKAEILNILKKEEQCQDS